VVHVDKIDSPERVGVSSKIGTRTPLHSAALGKALLAAQSDTEIDQYIHHAVRMPAPDRLGQPQLLRAELQVARLTGFTVDDEEDSIGVRCIGAAILAGHGEPVFAISITGPSGRFTMERANTFAPALIEAARGLSRNLGWNEPGSPS
jgi:IclR family acetate operon transcriptional repressor